MAELAQFVDEVMKKLRALCYKAKGDARFGCLDLFFYRSNSGVWERRQMTDAAALRLIKTHVGALVEMYRGDKSAEVVTLLRELDELVGQGRGKDRVQALLDELERVSGS
jgi:hypothetical protein